MNVCRFFPTKLSHINYAHAQYLSYYRTKICSLTVRGRQCTKGHISPTQRYLHVQSKNSAQKYSGNLNHRMDKVPEDFKLIYKHDLGLWFLGVRIGFGAFCGGILFYGISLPSYSFDFLFSDQVGQMVCLSLGWFVVMFLIFAFMARPYTLRIYQHDNGQFISVRRSVFGRLKQLKYFADDITPYRVKGKESADKPWESVHLTIHGQKVYLQAKYFLSPIYYNYHCKTSSRSDDSLMAREPDF